MGAAPNRIGFAASTCLVVLFGIATALWILLALFLALIQFGGSLGPSGWKEWVVGFSIFLVVTAAALAATTAAYEAAQEFRRRIEGRAPGLRSLWAAALALAGLAAAGRGTYALVFENGPWALAASALVAMLCTTALTCLRLGASAPGTCP